MTSLLISDDLAKRLAELAAKAQLSKNEYATQLLEEILEDQEDYFEARKVSLRLAKGEEETIPFEEILKKYGMEDDPL
jgi:predicted DNA-binding protein